jgi:signal peptidase II
MPVILLFLTAALAVVADQTSKHWALSALADQQPHPIILGFLQLDLSTNTGAAFGILQSNASRLGFVAVGLCIVIVMAAIMLRKSLTFPLALAIGLPLGGAIGNLIDRLNRGYVVDFIDAYIGRHHWPTFNVADSCICIGAVLLLLISFRGRKSDSKVEPPRNVER